MLQFSNVRGSSYDPSSTIKQAMSDVDFSGFYIRVKGLDGGGFGLRKTHLKKEDALKALSEKSMNGWVARQISSMTQSLAILPPHLWHCSSHWSKN